MSKKDKISGHDSAHQFQYKAFKISEEVFDLLKKSVPVKYSKMVSKEEMRGLTFKCEDMKSIFYTQDTMVARLFHLKRVPEIKDYIPKEIWDAANKMSQKSSYPVILYLDRHLSGVTFQKTYTGSRAYCKMRKYLSTYYSDAEIEERLSMFEYDGHVKQIHYLRPVEIGKIYKFTNCSEYDINSAYCSILANEIFPKAHDLLVSLYAARKEKPENKALFNYFVGMLTRKGHRLTYNYIVKSISDKLGNFIMAHGGYENLIYANTDGAVIKDVDGMIYGGSKELGDFKVETRGDCYLYKGKNYWTIQQNEVLKGSILWQVRNKINLRLGVTVDYEPTLAYKSSELDDSKRVYWYEAQNVKEVVPVTISDTKEVKKEVKKPKIKLDMEAIDIFTKKFNLKETRHEDSKEDLLQQEIREDSNEDLSIPDRALSKLKISPEEWQTFRQVTGFSRQARGHS